MALVGARLGNSDGRAVGARDGSLVGSFVGLFVGTPASAVGGAVGLAVVGTGELGSLVGTAVVGAEVHAAATACASSSVFEMTTSAPSSLFQPALYRSSHEVAASAGRVNTCGIIQYLQSRL
jgi:hypothetical protein